MDNNLKLFKLISGEELLATVLEDEETSFTVEKAVSLVYSSVEGKGMVTNFAPFFPYSDGPIVLMKQSVSCISQIQDKVKEEYRKIFSDIIIAPANAI